jgi:hypothetical protein
MKLQFLIFTVFALPMVPPNPANGRILPFSPIKRITASISSESESINKVRFKNPIEEVKIIPARQFIPESERFSHKISTSKAVIQQHVQNAVREVAHLLQPSLPKTSAKLFSEEYFNALQDISNIWTRNTVRSSLEDKQAIRFFQNRIDISYFERHIHPGISPHDFQEVFEKAVRFESLYAGLKGKKLRVDLVYNHLRPKS